jgi:deazaflavin-dependent oxidoreductase (nitroreductase family)
MSKNREALSSSTERESKCERLVVMEGDRAVLCDLPKGHAEARPCRPSDQDLQAINRRVITDYRAGIRIDGFDREHLILLTTRGVKTGQPRTTPVGFYPDDDRLLIVANNLAAERNPDWYRNLTATPLVTVEADDHTFEAVATTLLGEDRERAWLHIMELNPSIAEHQAGTARTLPIVVVVPLR